VTQTKVGTLVIGAGVSGLATANVLGGKRGNVLVLERDSEIGGYCKTVQVSGFTWDYSGHFFHFRHKSVEAWLRARMGGQEVRTVQRKSLVRYKGKDIDFPFQRNIKQLPPEEYEECRRDLSGPEPKGPFTDFKQMLFARYGKGICEKFLIPYNEKLYATDLSTLDVEAMGRFFPHAPREEILREAEQPPTYNATFTYPRGGAIEYIYALRREVEDVRVSEPVQRIDLPRKVAITAKGEYAFDRLVSSAPFPALLKLCGMDVPPVFTWNKVLVFNLGFSGKGPSGVHWMYFPDRSRAFYRVGFYDNIFDQDLMSLYVELGFPKDAPLDRATIGSLQERVLAGLRAEGIVTTQDLVASHHVVMDPAYVHITQDSIRARKELGAQLEQLGVHSIGRYGGWTYCSIEDNIVEAKQLAQTFGGNPKAFGLD
jgi:protoporphyrinogen oxidase